MNTSCRWLLPCLLLLLSLSPLACVSPQPVYRLSSIEDNPLWLRGKEYIVKKTKDYVVGLRFSHMWRGLLVFDADVTNLSDRDLLIDPATFYSLPRRDTGRVVSESNLRDAVFAVNPERMIEQLDRQISVESAAATNAAITDLAVETADLALEAATIGTHQSEAEAEHKTRSRRERESTRLSQEIRYNTTMHRFLDERAEWETYSLRKHTLSPQQSIQGSVYFPVQRKAKFLTIIIPIAGTESAFDYRQEEVK